MPAGPALLLTLLTNRDSRLFFFSFYRLLAPISTNLLGRTLVARCSRVTVGRQEFNQRPCLTGQKPVSRLFSSSVKKKKRSYDKVRRQRLKEKQKKVGMKKKSCWSASWAPIGEPSHCLPSVYLFISYQCK